MTFLETAATANAILTPELAAAMPAEDRSLWIEENIFCLHPDLEDVSVTSRFGLRLADFIEDKLETLK